MNESRKKKFLLSLLVLFAISLHALANSTLSDADKFVLVIDAGHGGKDAGAIGSYSKEKNINLNVALEFGRLVEQNCPDVKIIYTRKTDVFIELNERANIANRAKADLFVSVHTNALPAGRIAYGSETYTLGTARSAENLDVAKRENSVILVENNYKQKYEGFNPNSSESYIIFEFMQDEHMKQSVSLAKSIQKYYVSMAGRQNKGVHQAGFLVLRKTSMPSVLTELGFISTPAEEAFLNSEDGIRKLARSIFEGFLDYKQTQDGKKRINIPFRPTDEAEETPVQEKKKEGNTTKATAQPTTKDKETTVEKETTSNSAIEKKKETAPTEQKSSAQEGVRFKIQILSSNHKLRADDHHFKGETNIGCYQENNLFKYTYGDTSSYKDILALNRQVKEKFPDAFVVAFRNGEKISIAEALRSIKNK